MRGISLTITSCIWLEFVCSHLIGIQNLSHLDSKKSACKAGDPGSIPRSGRSPGKGNGNPLQYSCLENPVDRGAWWARVRGVTKSWTQLSNDHLVGAEGNVLNLLKY